MKIESQIQINLLNTVTKSFGKMHSHHQMMTSQK